MKKLSNYLIKLFIIQKYKTYLSIINTLITQL